MTLRGTLLAACWLTASVVTSAAAAEPGSSDACKSAERLEGAAMYGLWRAEFAGVALGATLLIEKHPEYREGLTGGVNRDGTKAQIAGDVDDGTLTLEEAGDGEHIDANWTGRAKEGACGKEIEGTWTNAKTRQALPFVLRRVPGWQ